MAIPVKLEVFEGPLDLLMHLIEKDKINIYDIPVSSITDQYIAYIDMMHKNDLDVTSEFMVMAATLIDIKCRMLLPKEVDDEGDEVDPRQELVDQLLQYKMYKHMAQELRKTEDEEIKLMFRDEALPDEVEKYKQPIDLDELLDGLTLEKLNKIFEDVLARQRNKMDPVRSRFGRIEKEKVTVADKMLVLDNVIRKKKSFSFREILMESDGKEAVICMFLAVLEYIKLGKINAVQEDTDSDILINTL